MQTIFSIVICNEKHFNVNELGTFVQANLPKLTPEQRMAYDKIMHAITSLNGVLYFIDAPGGTFHLFWKPYDPKIILHWQSHNLELRQLSWVMTEIRRINSQSFLKYHTELQKL